ncbi:hypothetical protein E9993_11590 [Labilibacter sediminis]|nr:hypothetical protein E9993_11590 [Labilibacter sediminis]
MKRLILFLLAFIVIKMNAQDNLIFNRRFIECEDQWVAFSINEDSSHIYGFIYIDSQAGLTLNLEGRFKYEPDSSLVVKKEQDTNIKVRLENNNVNVAIIPEEMFNDLHVDSIPEWLKYYKTDVDSITRLYKWGYMYNGWGLCDKALEYLLKAKAIDVEYKGLLTEIAYSYNCLKKYDLSAEVLAEALRLNPTDAYTNKEYIYTLSQQKNIQKAIEQYEKLVELEVDDTYNAENCFNILGQFYYQKDVKNFKKWVKELRKWPNSNKKIDAYIEMMEKELKKN